MSKQCECTFEFPRMNLHTRCRLPDNHDGPCVFDTTIRDLSNVAREFTKLQNRLEAAQSIIANMKVLVGNAE